MHPCIGQWLSNVVVDLSPNRKQNAEKESTLSFFLNTITRDYINIIKKYYSSVLLVYCMEPQILLEILPAKQSSHNVLPYHAGKT